MYCFVTHTFIRMYLLSWWVVFSLCFPTHRDTFGDNMSEEKKSRWFNLLLYPDNPAHNLAIIQLQTTKYMACGICHNQDCYTDDSESHSAGELKKAHFHFILRCKNPRYKSGVAKELGIEVRFIDETASIKGSAKYLLHFGDDSKYQYSPDDLVGCLKGEVFKILSADDKPSETECYFMVRDFINTFDKVVDVPIVFDYCAYNGIYSFARRNLGVIRELCYSHNAKVCRAPRI